MNAALAAFVPRLIADSRGVTSLEYAVVAVIIMGVTVSGATTFGTLITNAMTRLLTVLG